MTKNEVSITREQELDYLAAYSKAVSQQANIVGQLLRFTKGEYLAGQDDEEIPVGTKVIYNVHSLWSGWTLWLNKKPQDQDMGPVMKGFQPKKRSELSYTDEKDWPIDDRGDARDPWQFGNRCVMKAVKGGGLYTFTTSSAGGMKELGRLSAQSEEHMREGHDEYPIIELQVDSYKHTQFGKIFIPVFEIVGWSKISDFDQEEKATKSTVSKPAVKKTKSSLTYR